MFSPKISSQATFEHPHPLTPTSQHNAINRSHHYNYTGSGPGPGSAEGVGVTYRDLESVLAGLGLVSDSKLEIKSESSSSSTSATNNDDDAAAIAHRAPMTTSSSTHSSSSSSSSSHRNNAISPTQAPAHSSSTTTANSTSVQASRKKATRSEYTSNITPTTSSSSDPSTDYPDDGGRTVRLTPTEHEQVWDSLPPHLNKLVRVPCLVYDRMTGDLITRFSTIHEASAQTVKGHNSDQKVSMYTIVKICEGEVEPTGDITYEFEDTVHLAKVVDEKSSSDPDKGRCIFVVV